MIIRRDVWFSDNNEFDYGALAGAGVTGTGLGVGSYYATKKGRGMLDEWVQKAPERIDKEYNKALEKAQKKLAKKNGAEAKLTQEELDALSKKVKETRLARKMEKKAEGLLKWAAENPKYAKSLGISTAAALGLGTAYAGYQGIKKYKGE